MDANDDKLWVGLQGGVKQIGYITTESLYQLRWRGGNGSKGTVPIHAKPSVTAKHRVYVETEVDCGSED